MSRLLELRLNITSILLKKVILEADSETWSHLRKNYLPSEYLSVYKIINIYFEDHGKLPSFDALKLSIRSDAILNKVYAIELADDVDIPNMELLEYLKNEYTQEEIMEQLEKYLEESVMTDSAKQSVERLYQIILEVEEKVDLKDPDEDMGRIELFESQEDLDASFKLGLNEQYDHQVQFMPGEYILIGGKRGSGKSLTCANIAANEFGAGRSSIYFTIEMSAKRTMQRICAVGAGVPAGNLRRKNLPHHEWLTVANWWASRFEHSEEALAEYVKHNDFSRLHSDLIKLKLHAKKQIDIVHNPLLTIANIRSELDRKVEQLNPSVIIVDYVNQVKRGSFGGQYDWTEQIEISKSLKAMAQEYGVIMVSPYQTDSTGEARFAKGLLDAADAAYSLTAYKDEEDPCIHFDCVKMRDEDEIHFTSKANWKTLKIGPETVLTPDKKAKQQENPTGEEPEDLPFDLS